MEGEHAFVWVFNGGGPFPSGIFSTRQKAEEWIQRDGLTGLLTLYPLDESVYRWAVRKGHFEPKREDQCAPAFIGTFSSGHTHFHYEKGELLY